MKKLKIWSMIILASIYFSVLSCDKDDDSVNTSKSIPELKWVEGNYSGTYTSTIQSWSGTHQNAPQTSKSDVKAKVTLNPDTTMTMIIRGGINITIDNSKITYSDDYSTIKCGRYSFSKKSQSMYFYESGAGGGSQNYQQFWFEFRAYKDIE